MQHTYKILKVNGTLYPLFKLLIPRYVCTLKELGLAMIAAVATGCEQQVIEVPDILDLAKRPLL